MRWAGALAAALGLLVPAPAHAQSGGAFPDGEWQGVMTYSAALAFGPGAAGDASGEGSFTLTVAGGQVTGGSFSFAATSDITLAGGSGSATVSSDGGTVGGPAGAPLLTPGDLRISGSVTVEGGITVPLDVTLPAEEATGILLTIDAAGCDRLSGDMSQETTETFEQQGVGVPRLVFRWSASRAGADTVVVDALTGLVTSGDALVAAAGRGDLDPSALGDLLGEAEGVAADLPASGSCPTETFSTPLSGAVVDLLTALTAEPGRATGGQLWAAVNAGVRTGVLRAGSPLAGAVSAALAARLDGAEATLEAYSIHLAALAIGDDALAARALEAAEG